MIPLTAKQRVIALGNYFQTVVTGFRWFFQFFGWCSLLNRIPAVSLSVQYHSVQQLAPFHRIIQCLVEACFLFLVRHTVQYLLYGASNTTVFAQTIIHLTIVGKRKVRIRIPFSPVLISSPLVAPSHKFGFTRESQLIERINHILVFVAVLIAQHTTQPFGTVVSCPFKVERINIESHRQEVINSELTGFDITGIQQPDAICRCIIRFTKFFIHQCRRNRVHPKMIVRLTKIRRMVVHTRTARTLLFLRAAQTFHITIVIIRPDDCYVIR